MGRFKKIRLIVGLLAALNCNSSSTVGKVNYDSIIPKLDKSKAVLMIPDYSSFPGKPFVSYFATEQHSQFKVLFIDDKCDRTLNYAYLFPGDFPILIPKEFLEFWKPMYYEVLGKVEGRHGRKSLEGLITV